MHAHWFRDDHYISRRYIIFCRWSHHANPHKCVQWFYEQWGVGEPLLIWSWAVGSPMQWCALPPPSESLIMSECFHILLCMCTEVWLRSTCCHSFQQKVSSCMRWLSCDDCIPAHPVSKHANVPIAFGSQMFVCTGLKTLRFSKCWPWHGAMYPCAPHHELYSMASKSLNLCPLVAWKSQCVAVSCAGLQCHHCWSLQSAPLSFASAPWTSLLTHCSSFSCPSTAHLSCSQGLLGASSWVGPWPGAQAQALVLTVSLALVLVLVLAVTVAGAVAAVVVLQYSAPYLLVKYQGLWSLLAQGDPWRLWHPCHTCWQWSCSCWGPESAQSWCHRVKACSSPPLWRSYLGLAGRCLWDLRKGRTVEGVCTPWLGKLAVVQQMKGKCCCTVMGLGAGSLNCVHRLWRGASSCSGLGADRADSQASYGKGGSTANWRDDGEGIPVRRQWEIDQNQWTMKSPPNT